MVVSAVVAATFVAILAVLLAEVVAVGGVHAEGLTSTVSLDVAVEPALVVAQSVVMMSAVAATVADAGAGLAVVAVGPAIFGGRNSKSFFNAKAATLLTLEDNKTP